MAVAAIAAISMAMLIGTALARMSSARQGSSTAQVAAFLVTAEGKGDSSYYVDFHDGDRPQRYDTVEYPFSVTNSADGKVSEVSLSYDVKVVIEAADDLWNMDWSKVEVRIDGQSPLYSYEFVDENVHTYSYTLEDAGTFDAGRADTHDHTIEFVFENSDDVLQGNEYIDPQNCRIIIHAEQLD